MIRGLVPHKTTMDALLRAHGLGADAVQGVVIAAESVFDPRRLKSFSRSPSSGRWRRAAAVRVQDRCGLFLRIVAGRDADDRASVRKCCRFPRRSSRPPPRDASSGERRRSFSRWRPRESSDDLAIAMAGIFSGEIDFNTEVQPGDRYSRGVRAVHARGPAGVVRCDHRGRVPERRAGVRARSGSRRQGASPATMTSRGARCGVSSCGRR